MNKSDVKQILSLALKLTVIVAVAVLLLAVVNSITEPRIKANAEEQRNKACGELIAGADFAEEDISALNIDYSGIENVKTDSVKVYRGTKDGKTAGWCVEVLGKGYSSSGIALIVGISADGKEIVGVKCTSSTETSGIGSKVTDSSYLSNYAGKSSSEVSEIDAISGATRSSKGIRGACEAAVKAVNTIVEKEAE